MHRTERHQRPPRGIRVKRRCHTCGTEFSTALHACLFCGQSFGPLWDDNDRRVNTVRAVRAVTLVLFVLLMILYE